MVLILLASVDIDGVVENFEPGISLVLVIRR